MNSITAETKQQNNRKNFPINLVAELELFFFGFSELAKEQGAKDAPR